LNSLSIGGIQRNAIIFPANRKAPTCKPGIVNISDRRAIKFEVFDKVTGKRVEFVVWLIGRGDKTYRLKGEKVIDIVEPKTGRLGLTKWGHAPFQKSACLGGGDGQSVNIFTLQPLA
jgi:hypothetical protein